MSRRSAEADPISVVTIQTEDVVQDASAVRILIVSDVGLYREALAARLSQNRRFAIVGAVERSDALRDVERLEPDMVLLDAAEWQGLDLATTLLAHRPDLNIVAMAVPEIAGHAISAMWSGFAGFVPRNGSITDVVVLLERLAAYGPRNQVTLAPPLLVRPNSIKTDNLQRPAIADLTPREGEILGMIELGLSNKEIARNLRIEVGTVKNHVHNILEKMNVRRRNQAAHRLRVRSPPI